MPNNSQTERHWLCVDAPCQEYSLRCPLAPTATSPSAAALRLRQYVVRSTDRDETAKKKEAKKDGRIVWCAKYDAVPC